MALWLSLYNLLFSYFLSNSFMNLYNQIVSLLDYVATTYSASIVESATTFCSFEIQLTFITPIIKTYPVVLLLLSLSPAISTSTYTCRTVSEPTKHNAWEVVPLKYLRIHYTISNSLYMDCSYTYLELPLHVQYLVLCTPWHTSSCQL